MAIRRKPVTHKGVATSREGLRALVLPAGQRKGTDCLRTSILSGWFRCADGVLGVNSGVLPVLAGVTA